MTDHARRPTGWQLEQNASEAYERYLVPPMFAPWADQLVETSGISDGDRVLDVGCGTGIVARRAAPRVGTSGRVVGLDVNDGMLAVAEETATDSQPQIEWRRGDATDLPLPDEEFDAVCAQQSIQFVDDPTAAVEEIRRVLTPTGILTLSVWRPLEYHPAYAVLAEALERHVGDEAGTMMRSPFPDWNATDVRTLVLDAGFDDVSITVEIGSIRYPSVEAFVRREAASSPLSEPIAAVDRATRDDLLRDVEDEMRQYVDDDGIVSPMESYVVTATR
ncbi:class I SAM-dependent methyltransferase [Halovivax gelatinilyticus]|uniref:class I SAM-dependent methyltransferase n=1 Tax=Halovivax gelatinilyticus TaxID=2961597 RepID=UPI0020CA7480|nr:methyltransferase domain-containing protein [Halovivax gelatinilyticus]